MPYIKVERRRAIQSEWPEHPHPDNIVKNAGELNYFITGVLGAYIGNHGLSYQTINDIIGALEGVKQEFYRRVAATYEDQKIKENGDVY